MKRTIIIITFTLSSYYSIGQPIKSSIEFSLFNDTIQYVFHNLDLICNDTSHNCAFLDKRKNFRIEINCCCNISCVGDHKWIKLDYLIRETNIIIVKNNTDTMLIKITNLKMIDHKLLICFRPGTYLIDVDEVQEKRRKVNDYDLYDITPLDWCIKNE